MNRESELRFPRGEPEIFSLHELPDELRTWAQEGFAFGHLRVHDMLNRDKLHDMHERFKTALHEIGHKQIAETLGWHVKTVSIEPNLAQGILGYTEAAPPSGLPIQKLIVDKMAICLGGFLAEKMMGHSDHRGCGSDMAQFSFLTDMLSRFTENARYAVLTNARSVADRAMGSLAPERLARQSWNLLDQKVII